MQHVELTLLLRVYWNVQAAGINRAGRETNVSVPDKQSKHSFIQTSGRLIQGLLRNNNSRNVDWSSPDLFAASLDYVIKLFQGWSRFVHCITWLCNQIISTKTILVLLFLLFFLPNSSKYIEDNLEVFIVVKKKDKKWNWTVQMPFWDYSVVTLILSFIFTRQFTGHLSNFSSNWSFYHVWPGFGEGQQSFPQVAAMYLKIGQP